MKKALLISILAALSGVVSMAAQAEEAASSQAPAATVSEPAAAEMDEAELKKNLGYFYGYSFGNMLRDGGGGDADIDALVRGLNDSLGGEMPKLSPAQQDAVLAEIRARQEVINEERRQQASAAQQAQQAQSGANLAAAEEYLTNNGARDGVKTTASGLQYEVLAEADGPKAAATSTVSVNYKGSLINGEVFDESRGTPATFGLNQVISGWTEALQLMSVGDKYRLYLHPRLAYGAGSVGSIPPNSLLIFEVELLSID